MAVSDLERGAFDRWIAETGMSHEDAADAIALIGTTPERIRSIGDGGYMAAINASAFLRGFRAGYRAAMAGASTVDA